MTFRNVGKAKHLDKLKHQVKCYLCEKIVPLDTAHRHQGGYIGDKCCWDERLKSTE